MPVPGITISSTDIGAIQAKFREKLLYNKRNEEYLAKKEALAFAHDLFQETKELAPTRAEIAADVKALGWKIPAFFKDGRMGRGTPEMWEKFGFVRAVKRILKGQRGRRSEENQAKINNAVLKQNKLSAMQRFVIALRAAHRLFLATGWLGSIVDLGGSLNAKSGEVDRQRGGAYFRRSGGRLEWSLWNRTPGIETMQRKTNFVGKAIARRLNDMQKYIDDHRPGGKRG